MATELLSDGIRRFAMDTKKLESIILEKLSLLCFKKQHTVPFIFHSSLYPRKVQGFLARNVDLNFFDSARY